MTSPISELPEGGTNETDEFIPVNPKESRAQRKARFAQILSRGLVADRLHVELPDDLYGEWVPDTQEEIQRMRTLGFEVDKEYAHKRALHSGAAGESKIGDTVFMTIPKEDKEIIDEIRNEEYTKSMSPKHGKTKEDTELDNNIRNTGMETLNKSVSQRVGADEIRKALKGET